MIYLNITDWEAFNKTKKEMKDDGEASQLNFSIFTSKAKFVIDEFGNSGIKHYTQQFLIPIDPDKPTTTFLEVKQTEVTTQDNLIWSEVKQSKFANFYEG